MLQNSYPIAARTQTIDTPQKIEDPIQPLLSRCALGDQSAFEQLYKLTSAKLFGLLLRILRREDWAEEVLQECYVNIWNRASTYQPHKAAGFTWMASIARNRALDWLRRPQMEDPTDDESVIEAWVDDTPGQFERLAQSQDAAILLNCLEQLQPRQRQTIAMAYWDGMSHSELSQHLGEPLGTIKTWVRRGLAALKNCLG